MGALSASSVPDMTLKHFTYIFLLSSNNTSLELVLPFAHGETKKQVREVMPKVTLLSQIQTLVQLDPKPRFFALLLASMYGSFLV